MALWAALSCAAIFGPYVAGVMTGQLMVMAWAGVVLLAGWPLTTRARLAPMPVLGPWTAICVVMLISTNWRPLDPMFYGQQPAMHAVWWIMMPPLVMVITWYWVLRAPPERLILAIARVTVAAIAVNAGLALAQLTTRDETLGGFMPRFWSTTPGTGGLTVAELAAENGRYTGIFNQPAEAGLAYGLALLCLIYLVRMEMRWQLAGPCAAAVVTGGVLSLSKGFLLGALPLAAWMAARSSGVRLRIITGCVLGATGMLLAGSAGLLPRWAAGRSTLRYLLHPGGSFTAAYTANRYGPSGGTLSPVAADVLHASPWAGFGAGGLATPYDSLWLEILVLAGVLGIAMLCTSLVALGWRWLRLRATTGPAERSLAGSVLVLSIGTSLGLPTLTDNRVGIMTWLILGVMLTSRSVAPPERFPASVPSRGERASIQHVLLIAMK